MWMCRARPAPTSGASATPAACVPCSRWIPTCRSNPSRSSSAAGEELSVAARGALLHVLAELQRLRDVREGFLRSAGADHDDGAEAEDAPEDRLVHADR